MTDLLNPATSYRSNYIHQLQETIEAYSSAMIAVGEALQNSIDEVSETNIDGKGIITLDINFDTNTVTVFDNGRGFPRNMELLFLGGTGKKGKNTKGKIGVGIKVTLFCTNYFRIRSNGAAGAWMLELRDAHNFESLSSLKVPDPLPVDPNPLDGHGTELVYHFPQDNEGQNQLDRFINEVTDTCFPGGIEKNFGQTIFENPINFPSPFCCLLASYLQRFTYVGDVLNALKIQKRFPKEGIDFRVTIHCSDPDSRFKNGLENFWGKDKSYSFGIDPSYMKVSDSLAWVHSGKPKPALYNERLGNGGSNLTRTAGFNVLEFTEEGEYEALLKNKNGSLPDNVEKYRKHLFPRINGILLTIGHIPDFDAYLPGGSRRVISCNGVITSHDIDLTKGRNQQYVRCIDLAVDVNSELNYGKTQLKDMHLVKWTRDYINEVYTRVLQPGVGIWVGTITNDDDEDDSEVFVKRPDLGVSDLITRKIPQDENDVIGLFFELAGNKTLPGYRIYGLSQKDKYDCRAVILREADNDVFPEPQDDTRLRVVEFKLHAREVLRDFDRQQKSARDINLVVAWDEGSYLSQDYEIYNIEYSKFAKRSPKTVFSGVTKYIRGARDGAEVQLLLLKDVVQSFKTK